MTPEWLTAVAAVGTLIVVAASSIAALRQLRHMHDANQLAVLNDFHTTMQAERFRAAVRLATDFPDRAVDSHFRRRVLDSTSDESQLLRELGNYLDHSGALVKHGMIDRDLGCDLMYAVVTRTWDNLAPLISTLRVLRGTRLWDDFEYFVIECRRFRARFPNGTFPPKLAPLTLPAPWPEVSASGGLAEETPNAGRATS